MPKTGGGHCYRVGWRLARTVTPRWRPRAPSSVRASGVAERVHFVVTEDAFVGIRGYNARIQVVFWKVRCIWPTTTQGRLGSFVGPSLKV